MKTEIEKLEKHVAKIEKLDLASKKLYEKNKERLPIFSRDALFVLEDSVVEGIISGTIEYVFENKTMFLREKDSLKNIKKIVNYNWTDV